MTSDNRTVDSDAKAVSLGHSVQCGNYDVQRDMQVVVMTETTSDADADCGV